MLIVYCETCGLRVPDSEIQSGQAVQTPEGKIYCPKCKPQMRRTPSAGATPAPQQAVQSSEDSRHSKTSITPARRTTQAVRTAPPSSEKPASPAKNNNVLIAVGIAAAGFVIFVISILTRGGNDSETAAVKEKEVPQPVVTAQQPPPLSPPTVANKTTPEPAAAVENNEPAIDASERAKTAEKEMEGMRAERAQRLLDSAKYYAKSKPSDAKGYRGKLTQVTTTYRGTGAAEEAAKLLDELGEAGIDPWLNLPAPDDAAWSSGINLLSAIDPQKDFKAGCGKFEKDALVCGSSPQIKIAIPYVPPLEYDFRLVFARTSGAELVMQYASANGHSFMYAMDNGDVFGFTMVNGKNSSENPSTVRGLKFQNNKKYTAVLSIRKDGIRAYLDGKLITTYRTDYKDMSPPANWKMSDVYLAVGAQNSALTVYNVDVIEVSGNGKLGRSAEVAQKTEPKTTAQSVGASPNTKEPSQPTSNFHAKTEYAKALDEAYGFLLRNDVNSALSRLERAKADPQIASLSAKLPLDMALAKLMSDARKAAMAGAAALIDKRPFNFKKTDDKLIATGKGSTISVTGVKDDEVLIEESFNGAKAQTKIEFADLSAETQYALAKIGMPAGPESSLTVAYYGLLLAHAGSTEISVRELRAKLDDARKEQAPAEKIAQLADRIDFEELETKAEPAWRSIEAIYKDKKWEDAKKAVTDFKEQYAGTRACLKLRDTIEKTLADIEFQLSPLKPGLWTSYWSGDDNNKFKNFHLARAETKISRNYGDGSPDPKVPKDNFGILMRGILRLEKDGKYSFTAKGDDKVTVYINGKKTVESGNSKEATGVATLQKGDHELKIVYYEGKGGAEMNVRWALEGGFEAQEIPAASLWYDTRQPEKNRQKDDK